MSTQSDNSGPSKNVACANGHGDVAYSVIRHVWLCYNCEETVDPFVDVPVHFLCRESCVQWSGLFRCPKPVWHKEGHRWKQYIDPDCVHNVKDVLKDGYTRCQKCKTLLGPDPEVTPYDFQIDRLTGIEAARFMTAEETIQLNRLKSVRDGWLERGTKENESKGLVGKQRTIDGLRKDLEDANAKLAGLVRVAGERGGVLDNLRHCTEGAAADLVTLVDILGRVTDNTNFMHITRALEAVSRLSDHVSTADEHTGRLEQATAAAQRGPGGGDRVILVSRETADATRSTCPLCSFYMTRVTLDSNPWPYLMCENADCDFEESAAEPTLAKALEELIESAEWFTQWFDVEQYFAGGSPNKNDHVPEAPAALKQLDHDRRVARAVLLSVGENNGG